MVRSASVIDTAIVYTKLNPILCQYVMLYILYGSESVLFDCSMKKVEFAQITIIHHSKSCFFCTCSCN